MAIDPNEITGLLNHGNLPQAETLCRLGLLSEPENPVLYELLGEIALSVKAFDHAKCYFNKALARTLQPERINESLKKIPTANGMMPDDTGYLLIKAWAHGFWSDVDHVLGQLLLAELTGRIPVIHWGGNSLFNDRPKHNAFTDFFEPINPYTLETVIQDGFTYFPLKWDKNNLAEEEKNKYDGKLSKMSALYFLNRAETVLVADYFTGIQTLVNWIPESHPLQGKPIDELYRYLLAKYIRPKQRLLDCANLFINDRLGGDQFVAIHARGTDKVFEHRKLGEFCQPYMTLIREVLGMGVVKKIFLMTDDTRLLGFFRAQYEGILFFTDCARTAGTTGIHYAEAADGKKLGYEILIDSYIASRADYFIGDGLSNPSAMIKHLKDWPANHVALLGPNIHNTPNAALYR